MPTDRDMYRYHFKVGDKIVEAGFTNDIDLREIELHKVPGWSDGYMKQVGFRTTYEVAHDWELEQEKLGPPVEKD